ncbi:Capsular exopolysaccharide family protein [Devosia sp. LC5]|uniref:GumC family protein n=1 Tax=Devosia sp. LC5 TaxID=1502724 RepID=UPI0004E38933|nr:Wzz/FepE/Etk N-terminal domain-containing protein [Devosia sp. LC5]KFC62689.1 Capsular exopolysaccharide family protein [Devosia sp. LC5]
MHEQEFGLRNILGTIRRQLGLILAILILVLGVSALLIISLTPMYRATTLVLVDPSEKNLLNPTNSSSSSASDNARVESEVSIAKSEKTVELVLDALRLTDDPSFQPQPGLRERVATLLRIAPPETYTAEELRQVAIGKLQDAITVERQGTTYLITISAYANAPAKAANIANMMAEKYIQSQLQSKINGVLSGRNVMEQRVTETRTGLVAAERSFNDFIISSARTIAEQSGRTDIDQMRIELEKIVSDREAASTTLALAETGLSQSNWAQVADTLNTQTLRDLQQRERQIQEELAGVVDGSEQADALRVELVGVLDNFRTQANAQLEQLRQEIAANRAVETDLQLQLRSNILTSNLPPEVLATMYELQQNAEIARTQYQQMLVRLRDIEAQAYLQLADSRIVSEATPPSGAAFPNTRFLAMVAGILGLMLGLAAAFLREQFIGGIVSTDQLEGIVGPTLVTSLPNQKRLGRSQDGKPVKSLTELIAAQPYSRFAEAVRRLMISTDQALRRVRGDDLSDAASIIMVTSANAGEGKTTAAVSLARSYAISGQSTILIDADLRRPAVHKELGLEPSDALADYLASAGTPGDDIAPLMLTDGLSKAKFIIGSNIRGAAAGQVVSGERFAKLLNSASRLFDVVIVDTPPVGALVDALYLAQHVDVIVNVVRFGITSQKEVRATLRELVEAKQDNAEVVALLNAEPQSQAETRRRFGSYYVQA